MNPTATPCDECDENYAAKKCGLEWGPFILCILVLFVVFVQVK